MPLPHLASKSIATVDKAIETGIAAKEYTTNQDERCEAAPTEQPFSCCPISVADG